VARPYKIPNPVSASPATVPTIAPAAILNFLSTTGIENLAVANIGVGPPKRKMGITPPPTEKLSDKP
jgi:hypothetical protein